jgi:hypothetical protein
METLLPFLSRASIGEIGIEICGAGDVSLTRVTHSHATEYWNSCYEYSVIH